MMACFYFFYTKDMHLEYLNSNLQYVKKGKTIIKFKLPFYKRRGITSSLFLYFGKEYMKNNTIDIFFLESVGEII